jgi:hypothetical protein
MNNNIFDDDDDEFIDNNQLKYYNDIINYNINTIEKNINNNLIDDDNNGTTNNNELKYYDDIINYNINSIEILFKKKEQIEYQFILDSYIIYIMFNAVIYNSIVGEKKMYELYGNVHNKNYNIDNENDDKKIVIYNNINDID